MKTILKLSFLTVLLLFSSLFIQVFAQHSRYAHDASQQITNPEEKKKIKVQCLVNDKIISPSFIFGKKDLNLSVKAYPFNEKDCKDKKELVVKDFEVILLREGKKIANQTIFANGSVAYLASIAKTGDTYLIHISEVFELTKEGNLRSYAKGTINLIYNFSEIDKSTGTLTAVDEKSVVDSNGSTIK